MALEHGKQSPGQLELTGVCAGLENSRFSKRQMPLAADNDVVGHLDAENTARFHEPLRHANVGIRWRWVAARMVVHEDDTVRRADDCRPKHFAWMRHRLIQRADADEVMAPHAPLGVEQEDGKTFHVGIEQRCGGDVLSPVKHRVIRL